MDVRRYFSLVAIYLEHCQHLMSYSNNMKRFKAFPKIPTKYDCKGAPPCPFELIKEVLYGCWTIAPLCHSSPRSRGMNFRVKALRTSRPIPSIPSQENREYWCEAKYRNALKQIRLPSTCDLCSNARSIVSLCSNLGIPKKCNYVHVSTKQSFLACNEYSRNSEQTTYFFGFCRADTLLNIPRVGNPCC